MEDYDIKNILIGHEKGIRCLCVIYNDLFEDLKNQDVFFEYIVSADCNGSIFVWKNVKHGKNASILKSISNKQNDMTTNDMTTNDVNKNIVHENNVCQYENSINEYNDTFVLYKKIEIHEKYVYALCYSRFIGISQIKNNNDVKIENHIYVYSGGNDKNIYLFNLNGCIELILQGHKHSICSIVEKSKDILISGDWNGEVFIWKIEEKKTANENSEKSKEEEKKMDHVTSSNCHGYTILRILDNHKHATYVNYLNDFILSVSQNNILHIWNSEGEKTEEIKNVHNQSVRDIIIFNQNKNVLTFSNDESIHIYDTNFNILKVYKGHTGFIFYVFVNEEKQIMVSCSDDKTMKIWNIADIYEMMKNYKVSLLPETNMLANTNTCMQTIHLTDTIWSVKKLHNDDFVCACNDRFMRIYTNEEKNKLQQQIKQKFEKEYMKKEEKLEDKDVSSIDELHKTKGKEGEVKIFKNKNNYEAYKYEKGQWMLIGNVVDDAASSKKFYGGDHIFKQGYYDELFSIDIGNGMIKVLPYNKNDNVALIAENFCRRESIHSSNVKSIVDFVNENKPDKNTTKTTTEEEIHSKFNTVLSVFSIPKAALDKILEKIKEFNKYINEKHKLSDTEIKMLTNIISIYKFDIKNTYKFNNSDINLIIKLFEWPAKYNFPVIDLFRILILNKNCDFLFNNKYPISLFKLIYDCVALCIQNIKETSELDIETQKQTTALLLCCLRCYVNMFYLPTIRYEMFKKYNFVSKQLVSINSDNININILCLKIFFNYIITLNATNDNTIRNSLFEYLNSFKTKISDAEALYIYSICFHTSYCTYKIQTVEFLNKYDAIYFIKNKFKDLSSQKKQENSQNEKFLKNISLILESFNI